MAGVRPDAGELAKILDTLHGREPSPQTHKLIAVLRSAPAQIDSADERRRFFHATRALATGLRAAA